MPTSEWFQNKWYGKRETWSIMGTDTTGSELSHLSTIFTVPFMRSQIDSGIHTNIIFASPGEGYLRPVIFSLHAVGDSSRKTCFPKAWARPRSKAMPSSGFHSHLCPTWISELILSAFHLLVAVKHSVMLSSITYLQTHDIDTTSLGIVPLALQSPLLPFWTNSLRSLCLKHLIHKSSNTISTTLQI